MTISELPMVAVTDLTRRSKNAQLYKQGKVQSPDDLQCEIVADGKIGQLDLHKLEKEVNKNAEKKLKAIRDNAMLQASRTSMALTDAQRRAQQPDGAANDLEANNGNVRQGDAMFEEQLIDNRDRGGLQDVANRGLPRVRAWALCGGFLRRH